MRRILLFLSITACFTTATYGHENEGSSFYEGHMNDGDDILNITPYQNPQKRTRADAELPTPTDTPPQKMRYISPSPDVTQGSAPLSLLSIVSEESSDLIQRTLEIAQDSTIHQDGFMEYTLAWNIQNSIVNHFYPPAMSLKNIKALGSQYLLQSVAKGNIFGAYLFAQNIFKQPYNQPMKIVQFRYFIDNYRSFKELAHTSEAITKLIDLTDAYENDRSDFIAHFYPTDFIDASFFLNEALNDELLLNTEEAWTYLKKIRDINLTLEKKNKKRCDVSIDTFIRFYQYAHTELQKEILEWALKDSQKPYFECVRLTNPHQQSEDDIISQMLAPDLPSRY